MSDKSDRSVEIAAWRKPLRGFGDAVQNQFFILEHAFEEYFENTFGGYRDLHNAFMEFAGSTLTTALYRVGPEWRSDRPYYPGMIIKYLELIRKMRAAELLAIQGYPFQGYYLLRSVRDEAFFMLAIAIGYTDLKTVVRYLPIGDDSKEGRKAHHERNQWEADLKERLIGRKSALPEEVRLSLQHWDRLFNQEVHGSKLSFVHQLEEWSVPTAFTVGPKIGDTGIALYMNRSAELSWLVVRLLPYLQLKETPFGAAWQAQLQLMDKSHHFLVTGLDKPIAKHYAAFLEFHLPLASNAYYEEPSARGAAVPENSEP